MVGVLLRSGRRMSTSNGAAPRSSWPALGLAWLSTLAQRIAINLACWTVVLVRPPRVRAPPWRGIGVAVVVLTVAVVIASMFLADTATIDWAEHLPPWVVELADEITDFGRSGWFLFPLGFVLLFLAAVTAPSLPRMTQGVLALLAARFGFLFIAIGLPSLFATIVKRLIGRARPYVGSHDDPFTYFPFAWKPEYASMPSGHATTAAAAAIAVGALWPRLRPAMWLYALVIMCSRVLISAHHPSDVIAAALVGVVGALIVRRWFAARRLVFVGNDFRAVPGPSWRRLRAVAREVVGAPATPAS